MTLTTLPVADLTPNPRNPRPVPRLDDPAFAALIASIRTLGIQSPPMARMIDGVPQLVYGHRRVAAARHLGLERIEVDLREMTDDQADAERTHENIMRQALTPLEEADEVARLLDHNFGDSDAVAAELGWSQSTVLRRARLIDLAAPVRELLRTDPETWAPLLSIAHLEEIARLPAQVQATIAGSLDNEGGLPWQCRGGSAKAFAAYISQHLMRDLSAAPWPLEHAGLGEGGPCAECPKRSDAQALLFSDLADCRCLDGECFAAKARAWAAHRIDAAKAKRPDTVLISERYTAPEAGVMPAARYEIAKKTTPGAVPAVRVDGNNPGSTCYIVPHASTATGAPGARSEQDRVDAVLLKRSRRACETLAAATHTTAAPMPTRLMAMAACLGVQVSLNPVNDWWHTAHTHNPAWPTDCETLQEFLDHAEERAAVTLWRQVGGLLAKRLLALAKGKPDPDEIEHLATLIGLDRQEYNDLLDQVVLEVKIPKSLRHRFDAHGRALPADAVATTPQPADDDDEADDPEDDEPEAKPQPKAKTKAKRGAKR